jgi:predicted CopG family antitoxin
MVKTVKIGDRTHMRLVRQGNMGDTFDDVINRLIDMANKENILLLYRLTNNNDHPRELYLSNPMYFWTEENYDKFLEFASNQWYEWMEGIIKHIMKNREWAKLVNDYEKD